MNVDDDPLAPPEDDGGSQREARDDATGEPPDPEPASEEATTPRSGGGPKRKTSGSHVLHEGEFTAPSVGPHTTFDKRPPQERLDFERISDVDAMGKKKRRKVVGGTYGPTRARVAATFATFFAVVAALAVGFYLLAQELDQPPEENPAVAPWSDAEAPQQPPRELQ